jgi:hypothetical protein
MGATKTTTIVIVSIILTIILVSMVNVGMSLFYKEPNYSDFCNSSIYKPYPVEPTPAEILAQEQCNAEYNSAMSDYNQIKFYIFAGLGFLLMIFGLFVPEIITKVVGLSAGGILVTQGIVYNFQNKWAVFITLFFVLIIVGVLAVRIVKKMK